jgi:Helix-hairpin-helix motif
MRFKSVLTFILLLMMPSFFWAQKDSIPQNDPIEDEDIIENFIENINEDIEFDFNTTFESLQAYVQNPINLNTATKGELEELFFLTEIQIQNFLSYRHQLGHLISIYELQAVPDFDLKTIQNILPFVTVSNDIDDLHIGFKDLLLKGNNEVYLRWSRLLENQKGFSKLPEGELGSRFLGDRNRYYFRFRHFYQNKLSYGITAEKDPGEEFFKGSNRYGFDFYSAHFYLKDYNKTIKTIALGDYSVSFGQGLILHSGFGSGKSAAIMNIKRIRRTIKPFTSVSETNFFRGAATTLGFGKHLELTVLASYRGRDGNLIDPSLIANELVFFSFTAFNLSGLHRTEAEIEDKNALMDFTTGASLKYQKRNWHIALNGLHTKLNKTLQTRSLPYNKYYFNGDRLSNLSVDYSWVYQNFNLFGETAMSDNGSVATINGLLVGLDRKVDLSILHRYFPKDYQALNPNPFAESGGARNENGLYMGVVFNPNRHWQFGGYFDIYQHPWLRFNADAPSKGYEYRARITYFIKRKLTIYAEIRTEIKEINQSVEINKIDNLVTSQLLQTKFSISYKVTKSLELRNRIHYGAFNDGTNRSAKGYMVYQDIIYKPMRFPLSFTARYAIFDTDSYGIRFYSYENDVLYSYSIPSFYGRGTRFYINLRYRGIRNVVLEARFAQTYFSDRNFIGSGNDQIFGNTRTEIKVQAKFNF